MTDRNKVILLILVVTALVLFATALSLLLSYRTTFEIQRDRLVETARSEARLIEAMFAHEQQYSGLLTGDHGDAAAAVLSQLTAAHSRFPGFGSTGEYTLARRDGDRIVFLLSHRHFDLDQPRPVGMDDALAAPMRRALSGQAGSMVGFDYRGERVLAAYEPVAGLGWGVVAKIDLAEIRAPYWRTGAAAGGLSVLLALLAGGFVGRIGNRLVRRIGEKEALYRSLVENVDLGITLIDANFQVLMTNAAVGRMLNRPTGEFLRKHCYQEFEKRDGICPHCPGAVAMRTGEPAEVETRGILDDGRIINVRNRAFPVLDETGKAAGFIEVVEDITERKRFENQLAEAQRQLKALMDNLPGMAYRCRNDADWTMEFVSQGSTALTGYAPWELVGNRSRSYASLLHPEDREEVWNRVQAALAEHQPFSLEYRLVTSDCQVRQVWEKGAALYDDEGELVALEGLVMDISDRKEAELALQQSVADLRRSNLELEQFAYVASHDLQEPLRMVGSYVQLLARRYQGRLDADADEFIGYAVEGATRMQRLINDLLTFSRAGRQNEPFSAVNCDEILDEVLDNLDHSIEETGAVITREPLPRILGIPSQVNQVFQNLLGNALKFHGQAPPRIHVSAREEGDEWVFSVADHGIGIDPQYFSKVFIIFQRLHPKQDYPGTGIGLALAKKIIEHHGGRIWIESTPGQGTTFFFTLKGAQ